MQCSAQSRSLGGHAAEKNSGFKSIGGRISLKEEPTQIVLNYFLVSGTRVAGVPGVPAAQ